MANARFVAILCCLGWTAGKVVPTSSAWACEPAEFPVAIDVGHDRGRPGAVSERGVPEFEFNLALAREILAMLRVAGFTRSFLIGENGAPLELRERTAIAARGGARVLVSIHHDSVQPRYLQTWTFQGRVREYTTHARGFSLFVSARNSFFAATKDLAVRIGSELRATGKSPSLHHAEPIEGEGRQVIDAVNGVYRFDDLGVLRSAATPAVLLEAGVIKHPDEELVLVVATKAFQADVARSITRALQQACVEGLPGFPPSGAADTVSGLRAVVLSWAAPRRVVGRRARPHREFEAVRASAPIIPPPRSLRERPNRRLGPC